MIADAPLIFGTAFLTIAGAIWWAMNWRYGGIIANRDSEIAALKTQRDDIAIRSSQILKVRLPIAAKQQGLLSS